MRRLNQSRRTTPWHVRWHPLGRYPCPIPLTEDTPSTPQPRRKHEPPAGLATSIAPNKISTVGKCRTHLSAKSQRGLIEALLLGVSDVSVDHPIERKAMVVGAFTEHIAILFRLDGELPADSILDIDEVGVNVGDRERVQRRVGFRGHCSERGRGCGQGRVQNRGADGPGTEESSSHPKRPGTSPGCWFAVEKGMFGRKVVRAPNCRFNSAIPRLDRVLARGARGDGTIA